jgi:hypothetical protein
LVQSEDERRWTASERTWTLPNPDGNYADTGRNAEQTDAEGLRSAAMRNLRNLVLEQGARMNEWVHTGTDWPATGDASLRQLLFLLSSDDCAASPAGRLALAFCALR